jgi:hypothetical protein
MFKYRVNMPAGAVGTISSELVEKNVRAALDAWSLVLAGKGTLILEVLLTNTFEGKFGGRSSRHGPMEDNDRVLQDSAPYKLSKGVVLPGAENADAYIEIQPASTYFNEVWFDPAPCASEKQKIPNGYNKDAVSLFMHELAHCFGMNTHLNLATGQPKNGYHRSHFDSMIKGDTKSGFWFFGKNARDVYGNDVPITFMPELESANFTHYGNRADRHPLIFDRLMYGPHFSNKKRHCISRLDLAIMRDLGLETV